VGTQGYPCLTTGSIGLKDPAENLGRHIRADLVKDHISKKKIKEERKGIKTSTLGQWAQQAQNTEEAACRE
jgi:hypothetical protein